MVVRRVDAVLFGVLAIPALNVPNLVVGEIKVNIRGFQH